MASAVADCDQSSPNNNYVTPYSVIFQQFSERVPVHDRTISFTYQTLSQSVPQYGDWIGLFRGVGTNPEPSDYVSYIGAKEGSISLSNNSYKASLLLSNDEELDVNTSYQLIYVTTGCSIIGCSQRFWFNDDLNVSDNASACPVSTLSCKCCQHNNKSQGMCSNESSDNSCNISQDSSSESLQTLDLDSRDFAAHGRLAFQNLSEWLAFMSTASRQKMHKASAKTLDELWRSDPKVRPASRSKNSVRSDYTKATDYTKTSSNASKVKFSMGDKNSLSVAESEKLSDVDVDKGTDLARTLLFGTDDLVNSAPKIKLRRPVVSDDYKKKPMMMMMMTEETCSRDQNARKSNSAEHVLSEKIKPQGSNSSVDIFTEAVHADDAFNALYLKLAESEGKLKSLAEELKMSTLTVQSQEIEIKQYKTIMNLQAGEVKKHFGTIQSQSLMLLQYREKMEAQLNELKNLKEKIESSSDELKEEKKQNKLLTKKLEEANGTIKLQTSELDTRCAELHSLKTLSDALSTELNDVKKQEVARSSELLLLREKLAAESSDLKLSKHRGALDTAELQQLRTETELKSAELMLLRDRDETRSAELTLLQDQLCRRSEEARSLESTVASQSVKLMQLTATMASLTAQADTDKTTLVERLNELEANREEIERRKRKEEEQRLEISRHQANVESMLADIERRDAVEKKLQDELKESSDALQLCRAKETQLQEDLDKCRTAEETMLAELSLLRAEKESTSMAMDELKVEKEFLVNELHQSKSSNELLLDEFKIHKMSQEQASSTCSRARINAELLSRALARLRSREECLSDALRNSAESLNAITRELMLSKEREENLLDELAQLRAGVKPLSSEQQECHSTLLSPRPLNESREKGTLISKDMSQITDSNELLATQSAESKAKSSAEVVADAFQQSLTTPTKVSTELSTAQENQKSLSADSESRLTTSLLLISNEVELMQMGKDVEPNQQSVIDKTKEELLLSAERKECRTNETRRVAVATELKADLEENKINGESLSSESTESKVKEEMFAAVLKESKVDEDILMTELLKHAKTNEERHSSELNEGTGNLGNLSSDLARMGEDKAMAVADLKDYKEREGMFSKELYHLCQIDPESLPMEFRQCDMNSRSLSNKPEDSKFKECRIKEDLDSTEHKRSSANKEIKEGIQYAELKQSKTSEDVLAIDLEKCGITLTDEIDKHMISAQLRKIKSSEERLSLELQQRKVCELLLFGEIIQLQTYAACETSGPLSERDKSTTTSQGLVEYMTGAGHCQPKRSCEASEEDAMRQPSTGEEVPASTAALQNHSKLSRLSIIDHFQKRITAQSEEILQCKEKIELLLYKSLLTVSQNRSVCEDLTDTGIKGDAVKGSKAKAQAAMMKKASQTIDILFEQLRKEQEFRENLFTLHDLKNKELYRQISVLNNMVVTSQHQLNNITQIWREPAKHAEADDVNNPPQENNLTKSAANQHSAPSKAFRSGSSDKAFIGSDRSKKIRNTNSTAKGRGAAETTRMAGKLDNRLSRSADFQKSAAMSGRKKSKLSAAFNSRVTNDTEASLKKVDDLHQNCDDDDDEHSPSMKKRDAKSYESCDDKRSEELLLQFLAFSGAEIDQPPIPPDDELVASASESCQAQRKGNKRLSLSLPPKLGAQKVSAVLKGKPTMACKKLTQSDRSDVVHSPDQLSASTSVLLPAEEECSQDGPLDLSFSHKSTSPQSCKTVKPKRDTPSQLTKRQPGSLSKTARATDSTGLNRSVKKAARNLEPQMKGLKAARDSVVQRPRSAVQRPRSAGRTDCGPRSEGAKRSFTALKQLTNEMNNYFDSVAEVYPEEISLDVVNCFSADDDNLTTTQGLGFGSRESRNNRSQNETDILHQQRNEALSNSFPISSEMFSVMASQFVEMLAESHLKMPDKCNTGIGPRSDSRASSRQSAAHKSPNRQGLESTGNLRTGGNVSPACGSVLESKPNTMPSTASFFSDSVEPSVQESRSTCTQKTQNEKYPVQDDGKQSPRPNLASRQKSEPTSHKRPWHSTSQHHSLGPVSDATSGRRDGGLGYACSPSLQKKLGAMKADQSQAKLGNEPKRPRRMSAKPLLVKPVRGKGGYAALAKKVSWNADGKNTQLQKPKTKCSREDGETSVTI